MMHETHHRRRAPNPFTPVARDPEAQIGANSSSNSKSKESVLALTIVILLFLVAIVIMGYAYYNERLLRFELEQENNLNIEVIRACDRMQLRQKHADMEAHMAGGIGLGLGAGLGGTGSGSASGGPNGNALSMNKINKRTTRTHQQQQQQQQTPACSPCSDCVRENELATQLAEEKVHTALLQELENWKGVSNELSGSAVEALRTGLQHASKEVLMLLYGPPPYYIEVELLLPQFDSEEGSEKGKGTRKRATVPPSIIAAHGGTATVPYSSGTLLLQLAPLDEMPYTTLYFLTHVTNKAWDGCHFAINPGHILATELSGRKCNPELFNIASSAISLATAKSFMTKKLAMQEYSSNFPHTQYTVGFSGRPGGPSLYINIMDNTAFHGPGGQPDVEYPDEADSCIATVTQGVDVLEQMKAIPVPAGGVTMKLPVIIQTMKIVAV